jgi:hypothetical protein
MITPMPSLLRSALRFVLVLGVAFSPVACKVSGEFDPDLGRKDDDDTVYQAPTPLPG